MLGNIPGANCRITKMESYDKASVFIVAILNAIVFIAGNALAIYLGFIVALFIKNNIDILFCTTPDIPGCIYIAIYIFYLMIDLIYLPGFFKTAFIFLNRLLSGELYKAYFYIGDRFLKKSYLTLTEIEDMGFQIKSESQENNSEEENDDENE